MFDSLVLLLQNLQMMQQGFLTQRGHTIKSVKTRIRIYVENMLAGKSSILKVLSVGTNQDGRNNDRLYPTSNFLMTVQTIFFNKAIGTKLTSLPCSLRARVS